MATDNTVAKDLLHQRNVVSSALAVVKKELDELKFRIMAPIMTPEERAKAAETSGGES